MGLFGSSGIRGVVNQDMTPELAMDIGMAIGSMAEEVVIGMDSRTSGQLMEAALVGGLTAAGSHVHRAGLVTTPTLAEAAREMCCGVMITASHNPPEYAGVKFWNPDGMGVSTDQAKAIERAISSHRFKLQRWDRVGRSQVLPDAVERHAERILAGVGESRLRVVVDCANGPASTITPIVLQRMGCKVITLNSNPDGHFPGRPPEPVEENLTDLKRAVVSMKAALGIAHDGDADRMVAVDDKGVFLGGDQLLALFAKNYAKKRIVATVDTSMAVDDYIRAKVIRTRVGDAFVSEAVKTSKAEFGGEPSGTWIFPDQTYCPDGILAAARLVELASKKKTLSQLRKPIPVYPTLRSAVPFDAKRRDAVLKKLARTMRSVECRKLETTDGFRVQCSDGWGLVRVSGTEPKVRIMAEARKKERAEAIMAKLTGVVKGCVGP
jgi:phosphoglucosamine mutase